MIKVVLFDLDGTLLPVNFDAWLPTYFSSVGRYFASVLPGVDVVGPLSGATMRLMAHDDGSPNEAFFWADYCSCVGRSRGELEPLWVEYYERAFPSLGEALRPDPVAREVVDACRAAGARVVLATNPVFARIAIDERLRWAGVSPSSFEWITCFENMNACKPNPRYYRQLLEQLGEQASACLVVGNDAKMDLRPAASLGIRTCLVENEFQVPLAGFTADHQVPLARVPELLG